MNILLDFEAKVGWGNVFKLIIRNENLHKANNEVRVVNFT